MRILKARILKRKIIVHILIIVSVTGYAQNNVLKATKINSKIIIDGVVNESAWESAKPLDITQKVPNAGAPPTQKTEIRIVYDNEYLYLSGRMYDNEPNKINANSKKRDDFTENTEWCGLLIDSYNDRENALTFAVTPTGSKFDMALSGDITGPNAFNLSWNSYWDAASTQNELGWFAEIRIPFSSLPFEVKNDKVIMGITAWRYLARNDETDIYPPRDLSTGSTFRPSLTQRFSFEGIENKNPIHITPYVLGGFERINNLSESSQEYKANENFKKEIGIDSKIGLGSNATLDLSANTDFAQVEVDNQQINLTRSNIFFPEKRLFFQERASLFNFNFGLSDKLFHSRRIGIVDGKQTRIYGGARIIGKFGKWEFGGLTMQTASQGELESENFGVIRIRKNIINENSTIGLIATNRADFKNTYNRVFGFDATVRVFKENYISFKWAQNFTDQDETINDLKPSKYFVEISKRSQKGFTYTANYGKAGKDYNPGIGFESREDFSQLNSNIAYNIFPSHTSKISQYGPYVNGSYIWNNATKNLESRNLNFGFQLLSKLGWTYNLYLNMDKELLSNTLNLPGTIEINAGNYNFNSIYGSISSSSAKKIAYSVSAGTGNFYDGKKTTITISPFINISSDFSIQGSYEYNRLKFPSKNKVETIQLSSINMLYTLSTKLTISSLIQHNNLSKTFLGSLRLRYNPKEGNDFYLVFNGDINQDKNRLAPRLPVSNAQTIFLKYSHTFHF